MLNRSGENTDITCTSDKYSHLTVLSLTTLLAKWRQQNRYNLIDLGGPGLKKTAKNIFLPVGFLGVSLIVCMTCSIYRL